MKIFGCKDKNPKKGLEKINEAKEIATTALDNIAEGILVLSKDFKIIWANKKIMDLSHLKEKEVVGDFCYKVTHHRKEPCRPPHDVCPIHEVLEKGKPVTVLHTHFDAEGNEFYAEVSAYPIKDEKGDIAQFVHIARDVTDRVKAEKALVKSKDYVDNIIKSMIDTLIVVNPDAIIRTVNKATCDLLGYAEEELTGKLVATIFAEEEEEEVTSFKGARMKKLIGEGSIRDYDMTYKTKSGEKIPVSFSGSVMRDEKGELVGVVGIARDMREIRRLMQKEKEFAAAAAAAAASEKKKAEELAALNEELTSTNEELKQANEEAQNAKGIAEKKAADLERFNKLAVGRELAMKELKERISQLEQKLREKS